MVSKTSSISLLIMLCWLGLSAPSGARIGETLDQVLKRYGRCLGTVTADNGMAYKVFSKRGLKILVHFYENKVDEISYGKDADIFDDELKALLHDNAPRANGLDPAGRSTGGTTHRESVHTIPLNIAC